MKKFIVEPEFWELFPETKIGIVLAKNIDNSMESSAEIKKNLDEANENAEQFLEAAVFSENPVVSVWRKAYQKFKTKKGARSSIENLLKRVDKGKAVGSINPLVDIYNSISLNYGLPAGGEDIDTFAGNLRLTKAVGGEHFLALGDDEADNALPGEICYLDNEGAVCRSWNWRDGQRTMLTEQTKNAFLIIESVDPKRGEVLDAATQKLAELSEKYLGGTAQVLLVTKENPEISLD